MSLQVTVFWEGQKLVGRRKERQFENKVWRPEEMRNTQPLLDETARLAVKIKYRVTAEGRDHRGGSFSKYQTRKGKRSFASLGRKRIPKSTFRVPEPYAMPKQGRVFKQYRAGETSSGDMQHKSEKSRIFWAYYIDRFTYQKAIGQKGFKNFVASGGLWRGLEVRAVKPGHVRIGFYRSSPGYRRKGGKRNVPNRDKAKAVVANEKKPILEYSRQEAREYEKFLTDYYSVSVLKHFDDARTAFELRKIVNRAENIVKTLEGKLNKKVKGKKRA